MKSVDIRTVESFLPDGRKNITFYNYGVEVGYVYQVEGEEWRINMYIPQYYSQDVYGQAMAESGAYAVIFGEI